VHAQSRVPREKEALDEVQVEPLPILQPIDERTGGLRNRLHDGVVHLAVRLAQDVLNENRGTVLDAMLTLEPCSRGRDQTGRKRGRAGGAGVPLQDQDLGAGVRGRERRREAAGTGSDHQDRDGDLEGGLAGG
jgi:hypothetical protein